MKKGYERFKQILDDSYLESIGHGNFDIGQEYDVYFDELFLGLTLKDNLLYIYYENCPGRDYVIYKWNESTKDFNDLTKIIERLIDVDRSEILSLAFHIINLKGK